MKKFLVEVLIWAAIVTGVAFLLARPSYSGSCSYTSVCPSHGISASFTGSTRMTDRGCIYGEYRHGNCEHWALCYCPGQ